MARALRHTLSKAAQKQKRGQNPEGKASDFEKESERAGKGNKEF